MEITWYRNAVFYSLDIETFYDSNGDGIGDFQGLISKLEYISSLGFDCLWLLPFYPSPNRDNGYDVMDYYGIDERLGTLSDFDEFIGRAREFGIKVIVDLVVNHTSHEHPWFQEGRKDKNSKHYQYYVWADKPLAYEEEKLTFSGEEDTMWTYDDVAGQYYLHRFYKEQPDLNTGNPEVRDEVKKIIQFWLNRGVCGFRIDAAELLIEPYGIPKTNRETLARFLNELRDFISGINPNAILLAEANIPPGDTATYLNDERMHMMFNFYLNQHFFVSLAEQNVRDLMRALHTLPEIPRSAQWLNFLRHHDELTLSLLHASKKEKVFQAFAPEKNMRIYDRGIRRRLATMLNDNRKRLELCYSFLFSMPGASMIRYGDEIEMGDDLALKGRNSVRTPMQWDNSANGGFSTASSDKFIHPVISSGKYGFQTTNVKSSLQDQNSLLNWMKMVISIRKKFRQIGEEKVEILKSGDDRVLIHGFKNKDEQVIFLHNFSGEKALVSTWQPGLDTKLNETVLKAESVEITLDKIIIPPFGYAWLKVMKV